MLITEYQKNVLLLAGALSLPTLGLYAYRLLKRRQQSSILPVSLMAVLFSFITLILYYKQNDYLIKNEIDNSKNMYNWFFAFAVMTLVLFAIMIVLEYKNIDL